MTRQKNTLHAALFASALAGPAFAQVQDPQWINPAGGQFENPANWSTQSVPSSFDRAIFDLASPPLRILANTVNVGELIVGRNDVTVSLSGRSPLFRVEGFTQIGGLPSNSPERPGRLRLESTGSFTFFNFNQLDVGNSGFASGLSLSERAYATSGALRLRPSATLSIELDAFVPAGSSSVRLFTDQIADLSGGLVVGTGNSSELPPLGEEIGLIYAEGGMGTKPFSTVLTYPVPGRSILIDFRDLNGDGLVDLAVSKILAAETYDSSTIENERALAAAPAAIETADLNGDGLDEIITATIAGKMQIYSPTVSGGLIGPIDYPVGNQPSDIASGDFDADGTIDLAISNFGDSTVSIYRNPLNDPSELFPATPLAVDGGPISLCPANLGNDAANFGSDGTDIVVVSKDSGNATGYRSNEDGTFTKTSDVEVGDEPGPSSPIDDENKKDPDAPLGVGGSRTSLQGETTRGILSIVQADPSSGLLEVIATANLSGLPIDIASADIDGDGRAETLTVTSAGSLDITSPINFATSSIQLNRPLSAIAAGSLDAQAGPEIIIATGGPTPEIMILRAIANSENFGRFVLEVVSIVPLDRKAPVIAIGQGGTRQEGQPTLSLGLDPAEQIDPAINLVGVETLPIPPCNQADFNGDGMVNGTDIGSLIGAWGPCGDCPQDLSGNGIVDAEDLGLLFSLWGPCTF